MQQYAEAEAILKAFLVKAKQKQWFEEEIGKELFQ